MLEPNLFGLMLNDNNVAILVYMKCWKIEV